MYLSDIIRRNEIDISAEICQALKPDIKADLLKWKKQLQKQVIYAVKKINEIDVILSEMDKEEDERC